MSAVVFAEGHAGAIVFAGDAVRVDDTTAAAAAASAAEAAGYAADFNIIQASDTTALAALDETQYLAAVTPDGRRWDFTAGDFSAQITASDPRYVAPDSDPIGASGAWVKTAVRSMMANADELGVVTGTVSDAVALANANAINAWLAAGDGFIFDCRADEIGIAATIRLGRDGNQLIGVPSQNLFAASTSGGRLKWQGADGGTMVLARQASTTVDLRSPHISGVSLDGNALALIGFYIGGVTKPTAGMLHVVNLKDSATAYAYVFGHNPDKTGGQINACYGGRFGQLTAFVGGDANGFLFTSPTGGQGACTFCTWSYLHVTCLDGYSFVFEKGDDNVFSQIGVSRLAGGTGGAFFFKSSAASTHLPVGNVIHNMNLSKSDGAALQIIVNDDRTFGNSVTYNGVDFTPTLVLNGGSLLDDNFWHFLGQPNYAGGWTVEPWSNPPPAAKGTATPGMTIGGSATGITFGVNTTMTYTRIGNQCTARVQMTLTNKGAGSGDVVITGLPFPAAGDQVANAITVGYYANFAAGITAAPMGFAGPGSTVSLYKAGAGTATALQASDLTNTSRIEFTITWRVS